MKIPIARTNLTKKEIYSVLDPLKSGWLVQGPKVKEFETKWSNFTGAKYSIAVTSCTTALHLSLVALGIGPEDEVIVPAFTWISTANVVEHVNAKLVFCDVDIENFNIDVSQIESKITKKTKAIIPVHLFGLAADVTSINSIAKKYNLKIIEDAACGFGSRYKKRHVGTFGNTGCFSFHPRKAITTGEGGMITTNDKKLAEKLKCLRDHGASMTDLQRHVGNKPYLLADHPEAGFNQRMTDIQAAIGSEQMNRAENIVSERQRLADRYDKGLKDINWIQTPSKHFHYEHGYQSYPCLFLPERTKRAIKNLDLKEIKIINKMRNELMDELQNKGISTRPATHAVHMLSYYKNKYNISPENFPNAYAANDCSLSIPLFHGMSEKEQNFIINKIKKIKI
ncbi:DegT/DnrJ/EryC1/StrS family aminotransferase [Candidatus Pelagibacter sp.]|nr:DegT/DnrJ/EryC1/StrS family aminotransferase [Candidatus Pelagibacter sp.]